MDITKMKQDINGLLKDREEMIDNIMFYYMTKIEGYLFLESGLEIGDKVKAGGNEFTFEGFDGEEILLSNKEYKYTLPWTVLENLEK